MAAGICAECGLGFEKRHGNQKYCDECQSARKLKRLEYWRAYQRDYYREHREEILSKRKRENEG